MKYVGFNLDNEQIEKLKVISFIENKYRTDLVKESLNLLFDEYSESFDKFEQYMKKYSDTKK